MSIREIILLLDQIEQRARQKAVDAEELMTRMEKFEEAIQLEVGYYEEWISRDPDCMEARQILDRLRTIIGSSGQV